MSTNVFGLFRVPRCDPAVRDKWIQAIKDHDPGFHEQIAQFVNVCQRHFDSNDIYVSNGKTRVMKLKPGAFPTYFQYVIDNNDNLNNQLLLIMSVIDYFIYRDNLEAENESNDILEIAEEPIPAQIPQNNVRLVKIVVKKDTK